MNNLDGVPEGPAPATIALGDTVVSYTVEVRPRRRHAAIQITPVGQVKLLVPLNYPVNQLQRFIRANEAWILKHYGQRRVLHAKQFAVGEQFYLKNLPLTLYIDRQPVNFFPPVEKRGETDLVYHCSGEADEQPQAVREQLIRWYFLQAHAYVPGRIEHFAEIVGRRPTRIKIHEYKTRWGYCREDGLVAINWRIMQAPVEAIDYVVAHELMHLRFHHHQKSFWEGVNRVLPPYQESKDWLHVHGEELQW